MTETDAAGSPLAATARRLVAATPAPHDARDVSTTDAPVLVEVEIARDRVVVLPETSSSTGSSTGSAPGVPRGRQDRVLDDVVRRWFGLDDDLDAVVAHLRRDPLLAPLVARRPHLRVLGHPDGFEAAVQTVLGQQVSLAAARTLTGRVAQAYASVRVGGLALFPDPPTLAAVDPAELRDVTRATNARARTVVALAQACADGLVLAPGVDRGDARRRLLAVPGIGPWTADYLALRALGDRDAFPAGDLVLRRALGVEHERDVAAAAPLWSPWRAYAAQHLWTARLFDA